MFEDVISMTEHSRIEFTAKVRDSFGQSINLDVYDALAHNNQKLQLDYSEAEQMMFQINSMLEEARAMI